MKTYSNVKTAQRNFNGDACALATRIDIKLGREDFEEFWRLVRLAQAQPVDDEILECVETICATA